MRRRPPHIPQKRLIYVGCEDASEAGYVALLQDQAGLPIHLKIDDLGRGAGDPLARVEMAVRRIEEHSAKRIAPEASYLFLDTDQLALNRHRAEEAQRLADRNGITIVWQEPCFEAMLLRHMPGRADRRLRILPLRAMLSDASGLDTRRARRACRCPDASIWRLCCVPRMRKPALRPSCDSSG